MDLYFRDKNGEYQSVKDIKPVQTDVYIVTKEKNQFKYVETLYRATDNKNSDYFTKNREKYIAAKEFLKVVLKKEYNQKFHIVTVELYSIHKNGEKLEIISENLTSKKQRNPYKEILAEILNKINPKETSKGKGSEENNKVSLTKKQQLAYRGT